ncbi:MAG: S1 RNA-binding domain-containing protein, partial [Candidatus Kapaibacteriota bacterium]
MSDLTPNNSTKRPSLADLLNGDFNVPMMDDSTFDTLFQKSFSAVQEDQMVKGNVIQVTKDNIYVDIGFKSLGVIPRAEFGTADIFKQGDEIDVFIEKIEDINGRMLLSRRRADFMKTWEEILKLNETQQIVQVR